MEQPVPQSSQPASAPATPAADSAKPTESAPAEAAKPAESAPTTSAPAAPDASPELLEHTILVVDDNPNNRELIIDVLQRLKNYKLKFVQAKDGVQAVDLALQEKPHVILLDIEMPNMDGWEVCAKIRANADFAKTHIIVITAKAEKADKQQALDAGANQYIVKPYDIMTLRKCVTAALDGIPSDCSIRV